MIKFEKFFLYFIGPIYIVITLWLATLFVSGLVVKPKNFSLRLDSGSGLAELYYITAVLKGKSYLVCEHFADHKTFCFKSKNPYANFSEVYFLLKEDK